MMKTIAMGVVSMGVAAAAPASIITQWDFNGATIPGGNTSPTPSVGLGTALLVGGTTGASASGGPNDPAPTNDNRWNTSTYPAQGTGSGTAGVRYNVSTVGFFDITVTFDLRNSNTSSAWTRFEYTVDGSSWIAGPEFQATAGDQWNTRSVDLSAVASAENNASFGFRVVSIFAPGTSGYVASNPGSSYATGGTIGYDLVTVNGIPTPGSMALLAIGGVFAARRRRA